MQHASTLRSLRDESPETVGSGRIGRSHAPMRIAKDGVYSLKCAANGRRPPEPHALAATIHFKQRCEAHMKCIRDQLDARPNIRCGACGTARGHPPRLGAGR